MAKEQDRRSLDRFEIPGTTVTCKKTEGFNIFNRYSNDSTMENLSKSGICLKLKNGIKVGDKLKLQVSFPDEYILDITGHVRWKSPKHGEFNQIGIQFEPFGRGKKFNSLSSLDKLREIQQQYN